VGCDDHIGLFFLQHFAHATAGAGQMHQGIERPPDFGEIEYAKIGSLVPYTELIQFRYYRAFIGRHRCGYSAKYFMS
jgi:hypothetical protein